MGVENHRSYAEQAFRDNAVEGSPLGKKFNNLKNRFDKVKALGPVTDSNRAEVSEGVGNLLEAFSRGYKSVEQMENVASDPNKTERQKQFALDDLDLLGKVVYEGIREDEKFVESIRKGSASEIDENLPEGLKGIGKLVLTNVFEEGPVLECLEELDEVRISMRRMPEKIRDENLSEAINEAIKTLRKLKGLTPGQNYDKEMAMAYLGVEAERLGEKDVERKTVSGDIDSNPVVVEYLRQNAEYARASAEYARKKGILESEVEQVSLGELLDSYLRIRAPRERAPQMWEYEVPKFMGNMPLETWRKLLSYEDGWVGAIYDKRGDVAYNNMIDKMVQGILGKKSLEEGDLKEWYEDETLNLRGVMHQISKELLVERQVTAVVPRENGQGFEEVVRTTYVFDTERDEKGKERYVRHSRVEEFVDNEVGYKMALAERLVRRGVVANIEVAKLSVALAMDIMEMGGVFSGADVLRRLSWESDVVRLSQKPDRKFTPKVSNGELFAGPWTELANTLSRNDFKKAAEMIKSWGVVPELLAGSFLDQKLKKADGSYTDQTMMFMIYHDKKIPFRDIGSDLFFGWRKDHIQPAARTWMYIANKNPLEFSKNRENDTVISQWRADLYNDVNQLRRNEDCLLTTSVIEGMIGGSVGLWPFEGPYLRVAGSSHGNRVIDSFEATTEIVRQLGLSKIETDIILKFFGVDNANFNDLNEKMVAYDAIRNVTLPKWYIKKSEERLFKKRQH